MTDDFGADEVDIVMSLELHTFADVINGNGNEER